MDRLSREMRSWNMSRIRGRDTSPERAVRSLLHRMGYRFRLHQHALPGRPDLVLPRYCTVVFVHGCFWHRHAGCRFAYVPKTRTAFWKAKFNANRARDRKAVGELKALGWHVIVVWECELREPQHLAQKLDTWLRANLPGCDTARQ
ncbi:MAG: DNA mismatch endonuclease Vsr [Betaproteobacteria bacterium]|nr:DNA mismatch endonuclease Vsr [Betaproteobacteria bacterium]